MPVPDLLFIDLQDELAPKLHILHNKHSRVLARRYLLGVFADVSDAEGQHFADRLLESLHIDILLAVGDLLERDDFLEFLDQSVSIITTFRKDNIF